MKRYRDKDRQIDREGKPSQSSPESAAQQSCVKTKRNGTIAIRCEVCFLKLLVNRAGLYQREQYRTSRTQVNCDWQVPAKTLVGERGRCGPATNRIYTNNWSTGQNRVLVGNDWRLSTCNCSAGQFHTCSPYTQRTVNWISWRERWICTPGQTLWEGRGGCEFQQAGRLDSVLTRPELGS